MSILAPIVIAAFFGAIFGSGMDKPTRIPIAFADRDASALSKAVAAAVKADAAFEVKEGDEAAARRAGARRQGARRRRPAGRDSASRRARRSSAAAPSPSSPSTTTRRRRPR